MKCKFWTYTFIQDTILYHAMAVVVSGFLSHVLRVYGLT